MTFHRSRTEGLSTAKASARISIDQTWAVMITPGSGPIERNNSTSCATAVARRFARMRSVCALFFGHTSGISTRCEQSHSIS